MKEKNLKLFKNIVGILVLILLVLLFSQLFPLFMKLTTPEGRIAFQNETLNLGIQGAFLLIALQICKIILIFLPAEPLELVTGMCYGPFWGLIIIYIGILISNVIIIFSVKKYGIKFVRNMVPEDKLEKVRGMINDNPSQSEFTLFVLYFLPILPKDFITYIASLLPISQKRFLVISLIGRFPAVFSSILVGSKILDGDIRSIVIIYGITYLISAMIATIYQKSLPKKQKGA